MKRNYLIIALLVIILSFALSSCDFFGKFFKKEYEDQELFDKCASGVVLILNQYYYEVTLPNDTKMYFSDIENEDLKNLTLEEEEILKNKSMAFGTGFFVSQTGEILTNRHVAQPSIDQKEVKNQVKTIYEAIVEIMKLYQMEMEQQFNSLEAQKNDCYYIDYWGNISCNETLYAEITAQQENLRTEYQEINSAIETLKDIDYSDLSTKCISDLGVAYNNTYVTKPEDFKPCVFIRSSDEKETDLALIQLKDKLTPQNSFIFNLPENPEEETLEINEHIAMISYNAGIQLSNTAIGIQAQLNTGNVSQRQDGIKVLYSIPALQGSSGSPVVNKYAELVAVNFAGITGTQGFNYGVVTSKVRKFLNK